MNKRFFKGKSLKLKSWTEIDLIHIFAQAGWQGRKGRAYEGRPKASKRRGSEAGQGEGLILKCPWVYRLRRHRAGKELVL